MVITYQKIKFCDLSLFWINIFFCISIYYITWRLDSWLFKHLVGRQTHFAHDVLLKEIIDFADVNKCLEVIELPFSLCAQKWRAVQPCPWMTMVCMEMILVGKHSTSPAPRQVQYTVLSVQYIESNFILVSLSKWIQYKNKWGVAKFGLMIFCLLKTFDNFNIYFVADKICPKSIMDIPRYWVSHTLCPIFLRKV